MKEDISENLAKEAILSLEAVRFEGAQNELNDALDYYKNGNYNSCVLEIHKAYESTMKCILEELDITPKNNKIGSLITSLHKHGIFSSTLDNYAHTLKNLFEQLLPNIRNQPGVSHGQGKSIKKIDESYAHLALNSACTFISFLVKRYQKTKPDYDTQKKDKSIKHAINRLGGGRGTVTTVKSYEPYINDFCSGLNKDLSEITEEDVIEYLKKCKKKYSVQTLWLISSALRYFTNDYKEKGIIKRKFDYPYIRKKVDIGKFPSKRKTKPISWEEFQLLLKNEPDPKHRFWIEFIWYTGATTNQFRNVRIRDLDFRHNTIKLRKGNRIIKEVIISPDFMIKCRDFIERYSNEDRLSHLFIGYKGGFIHPRTLQNALSLAGKRAKIKRNIHCQVLRISNIKNIKYKIDNAPPKRINKKYITLRAIRSPFEPIKVEELENLCSRGVNEKHKFWFKIIYYLGIYKFKRDALYSLRTEDINLKEKKIKVNSKWVHLSEKLFSLFKIYFRRFPNQKYIFENKYGGTISEHGMRDAINRARRYNNIKKPINYENLHKSILEFTDL